jgi:VWFA-related protein
MLRLRTITVFFAAIALGAAQTPPPSTPAANGDSTPTFKVGGEEVDLDVVIHDKKGKLVKGLKPEDFTIIDNGEKRPIKAFRLVEGSESVASSGARNQLDPLRQIRLITLIFQAGGQDGRRISREAALDLLKTELGTNVYMAVFAIDHKLEAIQTFTNDRDLLRKAIERATGGASEFTQDAIHVRAQLEQMLGPNQGGPQDLAARANSVGAGSTSANGPGAATTGATGANAAMASMMLQIVNANQEDAATDNGRATIFALLTAVKEQYRLPGRKTVLYFTEGFFIPQGMEEPFNSVISIANRSNVSFYPLDARGLSINSVNQSATDMMGQAVAASKANATGTSGVNSDMAKSTDRAIDSGRANTQDTLARLAKETGGDLIANTNDFRGRLKKLSEELQTYYEIGYDPAIQKYDGSFRKISVKVTDPQLKLQTRSGYFALPPSMTAGGQVVAAYEVPLLKALDEKPVPHGFAFQSTGMHFRDSAGAPSCDVIVDIPLSGLTLQQDAVSGQYQGRFSYLAMVKDSQGQIVKKFRNDIPLKIAADKLTAYKAGHFIEPHYFDLQPGRYTLETAVLDSQGEKISARKSSFMVPVENASLSISSVTLVRDLKPADPSTSADNPLKMENNIIEPTISPVLKKSEMTGLPVYLVVYSDKTNADKPALRMEFSKDGQPLGKTAAPLGAADAQGRIPFMTTVPLAQFQPGYYEVRLVATQGKEAAVETATFTLEP